VKKVRRRAKISRRHLVHLGNVVQALAEISEATVDAVDVEARPAAAEPMSTVFLTHGRRTIFTLAVGDLVLMSVGLAGLAGMSEGAGATAPSTQLAAITGFVLFQLVALYAFGLQAPTARLRDWRYGARLALVLALGLAVLGAVRGLCGLVINPVQLVTYLLALFFLLFAVRYVVLGLVFPRSRRRRLAVVGEMPAVMEFVRRVRSEPFAGYSIVRICVPPSQKDDSSVLDLEAERVEVTDEVGKLLGSSDFDAVALDPHCHTFSDRDLCRLAELSGSGIAVHELAALSKGLVGRFPRSSLDPVRVGPQRIGSGLQRGEARHRHCDRGRGAARRRHPDAMRGADHQAGQRWSGVAGSGAGRVSRTRLSLPQVPNDDRVGGPRRSGLDRGSGPAHHAGRPISAKDATR
jgi:hypothetical protein